MKKAILCLGLLAVISGCGEKDAYIDNGKCTQTTVDNYNNIYFNARTKNISELTESCRTLKNTLGNRSCEAQDLSGNPLTISYGRVESGCEQLLNPTKPAPAPAVVERPVEVPKDMAPGINSAGECKDNVISEYNNMVTYTAKFTENQRSGYTYSSDYYAGKIKETCKEVKYLLGYHQCRAKNLSTGSSKYISYSKDFEELCNAFEKI